MKRMGLANNADYLHFLHEAYQFNNNMANLDYSGLWINKMFFKNNTL